MNLKSTCSPKKATARRKPINGCRYTKTATVDGFTRASAHAFSKYGAVVAKIAMYKIESQIVGSTDAASTAENE